MSFELVPLGKGAARIVQARGTASLLELPTEEIWDAYQRSGLLLFKGFRAEAHQLRIFAGRFSEGSEFLSPGRETHETPEGPVYLAEAGAGYVELHRENGFLTLQPDIIWFCCEVPSRAGGETTYCDGVALWKAFSEETRQFFLRQRVVGRQYGIPIAHFQGLFGPECSAEEVRGFLEVLASGAEPLNERIDHLNARADYGQDADGTFRMNFHCSAVIKTRYGKEYAFANQMPVYLKKNEALDHGRTLTLEDGSPLPSAIVEEVAEVSRGLTEAIPWEAGDLSMIDNSRFMHGRNAFSDPARRLLFLGTGAAR
jgi:alpha-ketoglutarate-dependent taurine dioxygenase